MLQLHRELEKAYIDKLNYLIDSDKMEKPNVKNKCSVIKANIDRFKEEAAANDGPIPEVVKKDFKELLDWINALK